LEPLVANPRHARFGNAGGVVLAVVLVAVAASCRHDEQRGARVAPDRAGLAFTRYASAEKPSVWVAAADGSHARRVVTRAYSPQLSPDGRRLAYMVPPDDPNSLPSLFVRDLAGGNPRQVGRAFGYGWSPDGARLAAQGLQSLVVFDLRSGKRRTLVRGPVFGGFGFAPDSNTIAYSRSNGGVGDKYRSDIFLIDLGSGR
jgi:Tol biopolymer transport system component